MLDARGTAMPSVIHWGADLGDLGPEQLETFVDGRVRAVGPSSVDFPLRLGLVPLAAEGWSGLPGLEGRHDPGDGASGRPRRPVLRTEAVALISPRGVDVVLIDDADGEPVLRVVVQLELTDDGVLRSRTRLTNLASRQYELASVASVLPLPPEAGERLDFSGVWANERRPQRAAIDHGTWLRESRHGRGGHDDSYLLVAGTPGFGFRSGEVWAFHLGWSGDCRTWLDSSATGIAAVGLGELLAPGEVRLATGQEYLSPWTLAAWSSEGLDGISARFHAWFRSLDAHPAGPRPLTLNTWEAVYFDHDAERLSGLVELAASVGVERFVLDDGWMTGRIDDRRALGDWTVDAERWPGGLGGLVASVRDAGMQFGLWVEPEMVSLESMLAREHPDWILREATDRLPPSWRHQYVLDLANDAAREHVRDALLALLDEYPIDYLKWDMNRDLLGGSTHAHVLATYRLMDELRERHPRLEIESCSSGGARIDAGILERTQRVWPSDTNDAHDRQSIVRWTSLLVPLEYLGSHVGSAPAHTTGRSHSLAFRLATALLGHAGIEWDLGAATPAELRSLALWAEQYKRFRGLIHSGALVRGDDGHEPIVTAVVAPDRSEALFWLVCLESSHEEVRAGRELVGLDPTATYRVTAVPLGAEPAVNEAVAPPWWSRGELVATGAELAAGVAVPSLHADEAIVLHAVVLG